jgi:hypothetical protein
VHMRIDRFAACRTITISIELSEKKSTTDWGELLAR